MRTGTLRQTSTLALVIGTTPLLAATAPPPGVRFAYWYGDRQVELAASPDMVALWRRPDQPTDGAVVLSDDIVAAEAGLRPDVQERGLTLLRVRHPATIKGLPQPPEVDPLALALGFGANAQPVFEQGATLRIPTGDLLLAIRDVATAEEAKRQLHSLWEPLGLTEIGLARPHLFLLRAEKTAGGRVFELSRQLHDHPAVLFAEPLFASIVRQGPWSIPLAENSGFVDYAAGLTQIETPPAGQFAPAWEKPPLDARWTKVLESSFEEPQQDWSVSWGLGAARAVPMVTTRRRHDGERAVYMTGLELQGKKPPGPYPHQALSYLLSPPFQVAGAEDAFIEFWFWAEFEPPTSRGQSYDLVRVMLLDQATKRVVLTIPIGPLELRGSLATARTTDNGWRRLLLRIPHEQITRTLRLQIEFRSDPLLSAEGFYVDEVRVYARFGERQPTAPLAEDPLEAAQWSITTRAQIAGHPAVSDEFEALRAPALAAATPVRVAILDDGVESLHPDLAPFVIEEGEPALPPAEPRAASDNHGTACAGVLGAIGGNRLGVVGSAPGAPILPLHRGVDDLDIIAAIDLARNHRVRVLAYPWGWFDAPSSAIEMALREAIDAGMLIITAAGDAGLYPPYRDDVQFPCTLGARLPLVCVGALGPAGDPKGAASSDGQFHWRSAHSALGPDLWAPGTWLVTTDRRSAAGYNTDATNGDYVDDFAGTGAAACYVAGTAAELIATDPALTPAEVKQLLLGSGASFGTATKGFAALRRLRPAAALEAARLRLEQQRLEAARAR